MKSGKLRHVIVIEGVTTTVTPAGTPTETWTPFVSLRAELVQQSTQEFLKAQGATGEAAAVFRVRSVAGLTLERRVSFRGEAWNIREIVSIDNDRGFELRCTRPDP